MKRIDFIKNTLGASVGTLAFGNIVSGKSSPEPDQLLKPLSKVNDRRVEELLKRTSQITQSTSHRSQSGFILALSAAFCSESSEYFRSDEIASAMQQVADALLRHQNPDGTFDGGNLQSPPDSAFTIEQLFRAQALLINDSNGSTQALRDSLKDLILNTCEALVTGGVHTPNHRWVISAALAGTNQLYPDRRYVARIEEWLGEGIGQDEDGEHPERSRNYDAAVNNPSLLDVAIYQNRPELFEVVRKNLELTLYLLEPNGEVDTIASRRQDQGRSFMIHRYYLPFRYMAIKDQNPQFAAITRFIEANFMDTLGENLADFLLHPELTEALPDAGPLPDHYTKHFRNTKLVRIRRENRTAAIFGGTDWHLGHGVWSGLSHNPTFFKYRKGGAILESVRMSPVFFSTGYFRSNGLTVNGDRYELMENRQVPYHLPLPEEHRKENGEYKMSPDGRFFSKMDFENRPKQLKTLQTEVVIKEVQNNGAFELDISVGETPNVAVTIELCFRKGGQLNGVVPLENDTDAFFLQEVEGSYKVGDDVITFGPGHHEHTRVNGLANEQYSVHNGDISQDGYRVYITGRTPFHYTMKIG